MTEQLTSSDKGAARKDGATIKKELALGLVLFVLSVAALFNVFSIRSQEGLAVTGPRFFPFVVCLGLVLLSAAYVIETALHRTPAPPDDALPHPATDDGEAVPAPPSRLLEPALLAVLLVAYMFVFLLLGYIISTTLFFVGAARILGSQKLVRDLVVGLVLSIAVYVLFSQLLGIVLPTGVLPF